MGQTPRITLIAGPNGSGKSTHASILLPPTLEYVNADEVAKTLPGYPSSQADFQAARLVLQRMTTLGRVGASFGVETTLSSRSLAVRVVRLKRVGYAVRLIFLYLPDVDLAISRVAQRVRVGGHDIPEAIIRRRFTAGIQNLFSLYLPLADKWSIIDTRGTELLRLIAEGNSDRVLKVNDVETWNTLRARSGKHE